MVLAHSRALLATDDGVIAVESDFRDPAEPGLVNVVQWRPDAGTDTRVTPVHMLGGVGRKI